MPMIATGTCLGKEFPKTPFFSSVTLRYSLESSSFISGSPVILANPATSNASSVPRNNHLSTALVSNK